MQYIVKDGQRVPLGADAPSPPQPAGKDPRVQPAPRQPLSPPPDRLASLLDTLAREVEQRHGSVEQLWERLRAAVIASPSSRDR